MRLNGVSFRQNPKDHSLENIDAGVLFLGLFNVALLTA